MPPTYIKSLIDSPACLLRSTWLPARCQQQKKGGHYRRCDVWQEHCAPRLTPSKAVPRTMEEAGWGARVDFLEISSNGNFSCNLSFKDLSFGWVFAKKFESVWCYVRNFLFPMWRRRKTNTNVFIRLVNVFICSFELVGKG